MAAAETSWHRIDLRAVRTIGSIELYFFADGDHFEPPSSFQLQYLATDDWKEIPQQTRAALMPIVNGTIESPSPRCAPNNFA